jgi:tetratricopeptide (TPR) repeat protein
MGKAKKMVEQVLASHPNSAKAHYLAAQIYVKMGERARAREELSRAQQLDPAMGFVKAEQLSQLRAAVGVAAAATVDPQSLTEAEHHQVDQLADRLVQQCHSAISSLPLPQNPPAELGLQDYIKADSQGMCDCVGTRFRSTITPALVRNGTEESTRAFTA